MGLGIKQIPYFTVYRTNFFAPYKLRPPPKKKTHPKITLTLYPDRRVNINNT